MEQLRKVLKENILTFSGSVTHKTLPDFCRELSLPSPSMDEGISKYKRILGSIDSTPDHSLVLVADKFLEVRNPRASIRNQIQDILWSDYGTPVIPKKFRYDFARDIQTSDLFSNFDKFFEMLSSLWIIDNDDFLILESNTLKSQIERHVFRNPDDWTTEYLFEQLRVFDSSDTRFAKFIECIVSPEVNPDEGVILSLVERINPIFRECGIEFLQVGTKDGYPHFELILTRAIQAGKPKIIIFASSQKPDIRIIDAVSNSIEIVNNADKVLVYDKEIPKDGLSWRELQSWWSDKNNIPNNDEANKSLYRRLLECFPDNSPPQKKFFECYYKGFGEKVPVLPALIPEVWLLWDHKTVKERGERALLNFRMDFLLLLPNQERIVIEIDGKQHYSDENNRADPSRYGKTMEADRELKLAGYHVFRFGAKELQKPDTEAIVKSFFSRLYKLFRINV